ncbi:MAG TPA: hypothetical protein VEB00_12045 [Clostridia bacterium]|nr:hypothetical protein [Clostridia bacterium]
MAYGLGYGMGGVNPAVAAAGCGAPVAVSPIMDACKGNGFLLLLLLFILLASCTTMGREKNFFFIIILAIIAFGGFGRTFGFGGAEV